MAAAFSCAYVDLMRPCFLSLLCNLLLPAAMAEPADPYVAIPGTIISRSAAPATQFIGSPSIAILPDGSYVACHDTFGSGAPVKTEIHRSIDQGATWAKQSDFPAYWSNLFVHNGALYVLGTSASYGNLVIRRSNDSGATWTTPSAAASGLLKSGAYHTAPMPTVVHNGRIWRAFEDIGAGNGWPRHFRAFLMSAAVGDDLLNAASWTYTASFTSSNTWLAGKFNGWLEGNIVVSPDGRLVDVLRADMDAGNAERAAIIDYGSAGATGIFDPNGLPAENPSHQSGFIPFPGGAKKFTIRRDPVTGGYWSLVNPVLPTWAASIPGEIRNTLSLAYSPDLVNWEIRCHLLFHPDIAKHGFQYVDWQFEGDDLVAVSRTSWDGSNYHDANLMTFHRVENFRALTMADSVPTGDIQWKFPGVTATGSAFAPGLLENGRIAYTNRTYTWGDVPAQFAGSLVTRVGGGVKANLKLRADSPRRLWIAASAIAPLPDLTGWTASGQSMFYNDGGSTRLHFHYRDFAAGEEITTSQTNWNGTVLIVPPAPGPVGHWRCESNWAGTALADENYNFHGKPSTPPPAAASNGAHGNALEFTAGQHVDLGNVFPLTRVPFTIAFWLKLTPGDTTYRVPLSKLTTGGYDGYLFSINAPAEAGKLAFTASSAADRLVSTTAVNDGLWHHAAVTLVPGGDMVLHLDGIEQARRAAPVIRANATPLRFGAQTVAGAADPKFSGWLDEIQIHHTALTTAEIETMVLDPSRVVSSGQPFTTGVTMTVPAAGPGVAWRAVPGRSYEVRRSTTLLAESWQLQSTVTPAGQSGQFLETTPLPRAFFRVEMVR